MWLRSLVIVSILRTHSKRCFLSDSVTIEILREQVLVVVGMLECCVHDNCNHDVVTVFGDCFDLASSQQALFSETVNITG